MGSEHYTAAQLMRQISEIARLSASTVDESERATRLLMAAYMCADVESVLLDVAAVADSAFRLRYAMIDAESKAANADAAWRNCFAAFTAMRDRAEAAEAEIATLRAERDAAVARAVAAEQRAEALAAEVAQARAEGFASGIHAAAEVLARRADAMSASGHHGYAYEVREVRLVVLEVLAEAQPAGEVSDG